MYVVSWGDPAHQCRGATMETGFFWDAIHLDTVGLYERASFNFASGGKIIEQYEAPVSFEEIRKRGLLQSKFRQSAQNVEWDGIVVIAQHPGDRSVWKAGSTGHYHQFLDSICKHYGSKAFIKLHPVVMGNAVELETVRGIAQKYGSECGHVGLSILDKAEAVFVYNSTFAVDAIVAKKPVVQYAPGYFWQSRIVQYTSRQIPKRIKQPNLEFNGRFLDFLIWKYCFHKMLPMNEMAELVKAFAASDDIFPLPEHLSYANFLLR